MKKNKNKKINWQKIDQKIHSFLHSSDFKKSLLLFLIMLVFFFDLSILLSERKIPTENNFIERKAFINPWAKEVRALVKDSPMEVMTPYISRKDKETAAFLVSIAKKESNWGKFSPKIGERNCYNYWGYRGKGEDVTPSGYTCFSSPRHAVDVVGKRIDDLINQSQLDTPRKMAVWKCGWDCSWDNPLAVEKWIQDVDYYYQKFYE